MLSYIIPYRKSSNDSNREANLDCLLRHLGPAIGEIRPVVVEQDEVPRFDPTKYPFKVEHLFLYNSGPYNKGWSFNYAVLKTTDPYLAFGDTDVLVSMGALAHSFMSLQNHDAVSPYKNNFYYLNESESNEVRQDLTRLTRPFAERPRVARAEYLPFAGGLFLISREAFFRIGGWDEGFQGWGGEDDAFTLKIARLLRSAWLDYPGFHLYHEPPAVVKPLHDVNKILLQKLGSFSPEQLLVYGMENFPILGNPKKYETNL